ncbi:hypothetical protein D3C85_1530240 [compost metagenome]
MNARFVLEGVATDNRFVVSNREAHDAGDHFGCVKNLTRHDPRLYAHRMFARLNRHDELFKGTVASTLADSVHRYLHMRDSCSNSSKAVGNGKPQIIMTVGAILYCVSASYT